MPVSLSESPISIHAYVIQSLTKIIIQKKFMQYPFVCLFTIEISWWIVDIFCKNQHCTYYANIYIIPTYSIHCPWCFSCKLFPSILIDNWHKIPYYELQIREHTYASWDIPYAHHYNPLLIWNRSWLQTADFRLKNWRICVFST